MELVELIQRLSLALAVGLLVGLVRSWQVKDGGAGGHQTAGIRTFGLAGLLGGLGGYLGTLWGVAMPAVLFGVFGLALTAIRLRESSNEQDYSLAGLVAGLVVFALGLVAVTGEMVVAVAGAVATAGILAARRSLHAFLEKLTWLELRAALVLLAMSLIALPLLPNRTIDPWGAINPFELWLLTVMIAGISCTGYAAIRLAGTGRGILFAGAAGGLASSTATTLSFARFAAKSPPAARRLAAGAAIAGALSAARVLVVGSVLAPSVLPALGSVLIPVILVFVAGSLLLVRRPGANAGAPSLALDNPLDLFAVLRFGALLGVISLVSRILLEQVGAASLFVVAGISGLVDVDAITLSTVRLVGDTLSAPTAVAALLLAVAVNMTTKAVLALVAGGRDYGRALAITTAVALSAGGLALVLAMVMTGS